MRGLKRKKDDSDEKSDYKENLSHFQTLARQRESIRLKNQCLLPNSTPGFWENQLNEKIHVEAQMIRGTAKFLKAYKTEDQVKAEYILLLTITYKNYKSIDLLM